jgi:hypothetical protein
VPDQCARAQASRYCSSRALGKGEALGALQQNQEGDPILVATSSSWLRILSFGEARLCAGAVGLALSFAGTAPLFATESGGGHYPNGAEDFMSGALPPPGTYFLNYLSYYKADSFRDEHGDRLFSRFDLDVAANTLRLIHVTPHTLFGANWAVHAFVPLVYLDVSRTIAPPIAGEKDHAFGIGDLIVDPFILGWHTKNWHFTTGLDIYLPTGEFDERDLANIGRNYWTFEPIFAFTYLSDGGLELSSKFMYSFNTENNDTNYRSGEEFHFDYTLGYHTGPWSLGVGGYYYQQTTDDKVNGQKPFDGFKGRAFAIGPQVKYDYRNMSFTLKYLAETEVENRPQGDGLWLKFLYAF